MIRAALYARFSTDLQREASLTDQFRQCERAAEAQGFTVVARYQDAGISGGTATRPGYQELLAAARAGSFDIIVAEDISRLWRNRAEFGSRSAELEDLGVHLVTCVGDDTRRDGWGLVVGLKAVLAEHARKEIAFRTRRALEGLALAGKATGGRWYGMAEEERPSLARIFALRASGLSLGAIVHQLNAAGVAAPRGGRWGRSTVAAILANPRYAGDASWGKTEGRGGAADSRHKRRVARSGGPLVPRHDSAGALIPVPLWNAAQKNALRRGASCYNAGVTSEEPV